MHKHCTFDYFGSSSTIFYVTDSLRNRCFDLQNLCSKTLIDILYILGFSKSYKEISIFETSSLSHKESNVSKTGFMQFVFDNVDFNIRTLDGHGTFHAMGGIQCISPSDSIDPDTRLPRITEKKSTVVFSKLADFGLKYYTKSKNEGLSTIKLAILGSCAMFPLRLTLSAQTLYDCTGSGCVTSLFQAGVASWKMQMLNVNHPRLQYDIFLF